MITRQVEQPPNPTDEQRYEILKEILKDGNRLEDFPYIIEGLNPPDDITNILTPGAMKGARVAILGGGIAGLTAAFELIKLGCDITIIEAEERLGGRIYTYYFDKNQELYGELGAMRIPVSHQSTWHYVNLFDLSTSSFIQDNPNAWIYIRNKRVRNDTEGRNVSREIYPEFPLTPWERSRSWQELVAYGLNSPMYTMAPRARQEILYSLQKYSPKMVYWTGKNNRQILETMKLSQGAINLISSIAPTVGSFFYNSYSEVLQKIYTGDFIYLYQIDGGYSKLTGELVKALTKKDTKAYKGIDYNKLGQVEMKLGYTVQAIRQRMDKKVLVEYTANNEGKTIAKHEDFDYVICTLPYSTLRTIEVNPLFNERKMQAIREVTYEDIHKTLFLCKRRFWLEQGIYGGGSTTDEAIAGIWYPSDGVYDPDVPGVLIATYNLALNATRIADLTKERSIQVIKRQVEKVHGLSKGYMDDIVMDYKTINWGTEPNFMGICYYRADQKTVFSTAMDKPVYHDRMYFAGVHISETHGWVQGAIKTAMEAASQVANHYKSL